MRTARIPTIASASLAALLIVAPGVHGLGAGAPQADLAVTVTGPPTVRVHEDTTYQITVTNNGPDDAPAKVQFSGDGGAPNISYKIDIVSAQPPPGQTCKLTFELVCKLGRLDPGAAATVTVIVRPNPETTFVVQANAEIDEVGGASDINSANDYATASSQVVKPIKIAGVPRRCASKPFPLKVKSTVANAGKIKLIVDDRVLASTKKAKLKAKVKPAKLEGSKHEIEVVVQDDDGGPFLASKKASFKTC